MKISRQWTPEERLLIADKKAYEIKAELAKPLREMSAERLYRLADDINSLALAHVDYLEAQRRNILPEGFE